MSNNALRREDESLPYYKYDKNYQYLLQLELEKLLEDNESKFLSQKTNMHAWEPLSSFGLITDFWWQRSFSHPSQLFSFWYNSNDYTIKMPQKSRENNIKLENRSSKFQFQSDR